MRMASCKYCKEKITTTNINRKLRGYHLTCLVKNRKEEKIRNRKLIDKIKDYITKIRKYVFD